MPYKVSMSGRLAKVPLFGNVAKAVTVNRDATVGAQIGVNLLLPDGSLAKMSDFGGTPSAGTSIDTTDDVDEGAYHLYFTDERAQDAVGGTLTNSTNVTMAYDDAGNTITADLTDVTVTAGGALKKYGFDAKGRLSEQDGANTGDLTEGDNLYYTDERAGAAASSLPPASALDGTELVAVVQSGAPAQATTADIAATAFLSLVDAVDDAAAAVAGVAVDSIYRNGSVLQIRVA